MDILDILLDILLKPPQPFIGLFFPCSNQGDVIGIDLDFSKPKGMPGLKLHSALASCSLTTKYINKAKS